MLPSDAVGDPGGAGGTWADAIPYRSRDRMAIVDDAASLAPIPLPSGHLAHPDRRRVYNPPTIGHPPRASSPSNEARLAWSEPQAPAITKLSIEDPRDLSDATKRPVCISPPRPDGHTRARIIADPAGFSPALVAIVAELRRHRAPEEERAERKAGPMVRYLPTPGVNGGATAFEVKVIGVRRQVITFYCHDRVHLFLDAESGECRIQWKAKELWSNTWDAAAVWLSDLSELLFGQPCALEKTYALGWRMTGIELCADFVGFPIDPSDAGMFAGGLKPAGDGLYPEAAETIMLGRRSTSNVSISVYDKTTQIEDDKGGDDACYRSSWIAGGYDGESKITRVELRLKAHGLKLATLDPIPGASVHSRVIYDFRNPAMLTPKNIGVVWRHCMERHRLVMGDRTRKRRDQIDPRWLPVIECGGGVCPALRQFRQVQSDAWEKKVELAVHKLVRAASVLGSLHGVAVDSRGDLVEIARFAHVLAMRYGEDLEEYGENYYALATPFVGPEIWKLGAEQWRDYVNAEGIPALRMRQMSYWTERGALDRALSIETTGPPGPQPQEKTSNVE